MIVCFLIISEIEPPFMENTALPRLFHSRLSKNLILQKQKLGLENLNYILEFT